MKIAVTGSTGLVGEAVIDHFKTRKHELFRLVRREPQFHRQEKIIRWDPVMRSLDSRSLDGMDVVIHLAGANIASKRWTVAYKQQILESRVDSTRLLSDALARCTNKPKLLICASAIGYYGIHDSHIVLTEGNPAGHDFLANVCKEWEAAAASAQKAGIRTVFLRFGVVLSSKGGALAKMALPFKLGLGGKLGKGDQMMSWIALAEIPFLIQYIIEHEEIWGAVNAVSPEAVSNAEFTATLAKVLKRPAVMAVPAFVIRAVLGEMADVLLLRGAKVHPQKLIDAQYPFRYAKLEDALNVSL